MNPWDERIEPSTLADIPGGQALMDWFGRVPSFHDGYVLGIALDMRGTSIVRVHSWNLTNELDTKGYFTLEKHAVITFSLEGVTRVNLVDFDQVGIIGCLSLTEMDGGFRLLWDVACGVVGEIRAKKLAIAFQPGKPNG